MNQSKNLSEVSFKEAFEYRSKLIKEAEDIQKNILYWSGICDLLKDKEFHESKIAVEEKQIEAV